ncbi:MAG: hypothetical protein ABFS17_13430 [Chloroflexota bacterium]
MTKKPTGNWKSMLLKALYLQITFLILHYAYDFFPNPVTEIFSGVSEAVYQHMKIAFYSYALVSLIEFLIKRKQGHHAEKIGFARIGATVLYPWLIFTLFFTPPAYYGEYQTIWAEIVSANIVLYISSLGAIFIEREFEKVILSKEFKIMIVLLFVILVSLFTIYTYRDPWFDVFAIPPGWE